MLSRIFVSLDFHTIMLNSFLNNVSLFFSKNSKLLLVFFIIGMLVHSGVIIYNVGNGDTVKWSVFQYDFVFERSLGRWMLQFVSLSHNYKVIPIFNTLLAIFYLSLASIVVVDLFGLKNNLFKILYGFLFLSSPFVNSYLYIFYASDGYCLGVLLAIFSSYVLLKISYRTFTQRVVVILCSTIFLVLSLAIYQATINLFVLICCIYNFLAVLKKQHTKFNDFLFCLILSVICYLLSVKIFLWFYSESLLNYKGINEMGLISPFVLFKLIKSYFYYFGMMYFSVNQSVSSSFYYSNIMPGWVINGLIIIVILSSYFVLVKKINKKIIFHFLMLIMSFGPIIFMSPAFLEKGNINSLISPQFSLLYILLFSIVELLQTSNKKVYVWFKFVSNIFCLCMVYNLILALNDFYYGNSLSFNKYYSLSARIIDRIEQVEGWNKDMKIAIIGGYTGGDVSDNYPAVYSKEIRDSNIPFMWEFQTQIGWKKFFLEYFGIDYNFVSEAEIESLYKCKAIKELSIFPNKNSIVIINDMIVVKLNNV